MMNLYFFLVNKRKQNK